jgi:hypothetical protein
MRRIIGTIGAMLATALVTPNLALASSHREAPKIVSVVALLVPLLRGRDDRHED